MPDVKPIYFNNDGDFQEVDPANDLLVGKGITDGVNIINIVDVAGNSHYHVTETITLSSAQIASKAIDLANTPDGTSQVEMFIRGAGSQVYGQDFILSGSSIVWTGYAIDDVIEENDIVEIRYSIK